MLTNALEIARFCFEKSMVMLFFKTFARSYVIEHKFLKIVEFTT